MTIKIPLTELVMRMRPFHWLGIFTVVPHSSLSPLLHTTYAKTEDDAGGSQHTPRFRIKHSSGATNIKVVTVSQLHAKDIHMNILLSKYILLLIFKFSTEYNFPERILLPTKHVICFSILRMS